MQEVGSCLDGFSEGVVPLIMVWSHSFASVVVVRLIILIPLWLIARIRLDHIDPSLVWWSRRNLYWWKMGLFVWKLLILGVIGGFPSI